MNLLNEFENKHRNFLIILCALICFSALLFSFVKYTNGNSATESVKEDLSAYTQSSSFDKTENNNYVSDGLNVSAEDKSECFRICETIAMKYKHIYELSEKTDSSNNIDDEKHLSQGTIDKIEDLLIDLEYPVINSDSIYPDYLEHSEELLRFWEEVNQKRNAQTGIIDVLENGGVYYRKLCYENGKQFCISAITRWNKNVTLELVEINKREILFWNMTENNEFYYQDLRLDRHWEASKFIRLCPIDKELYDLYLKYIESIGYHNVNMFLLDWDKDNYGDLSFNDLFSGLYYADNNELVYPMDFPQKEEPFFYSAIPAQLFEKTVWSHFDISLKDFRRKALFDEKNNIYPWQSINADNVTYYPNVYADVIDYTKEEKTVKFKVNVICPDYHCDSVFVHEVTV